MYDQFMYLLHTHIYIQYTYVSIYMNKYDYPYWTPSQNRF